MREVAKNCKTWKNAFFAALREGPNAIQRYPSLSQTLEKLQNPEKSIFCCFAGGRKTWLQNLEKCIFCWFPGRLQHYPTLSVLILDPRKIAKPGKMHFYWFAGGPKLGKIAKPGKMHFFAGFREGFNAIQRYPSLSQTPEKLQNLEKCIFCCFARGRKTWKNCKNWKNAFFAGFREGPQRYPTLSVLIPDPRKIAKPGKMHFLLFCARSQNLEKLQKLEKCIFCWFPGRAPTLSNAIRPYPRP